jgi:hypothetical protein
MSGRREQNAASGDMTGMRRCAQTRAIQRSVALDRRLRAPVAGAGRDLLLPRPLTGAILASKRGHLANVGFSRPPAADVQWLGGLELERRSIKKLW